MSDPKLRVEDFCRQIKELLSWLREAAITYDIVIDELHENLHEFSGAPLERKKIYCDSIERNANSLLIMNGDIAIYLGKIPEVADAMQKFMDSNWNDSQQKPYLAFLRQQRDVFVPIKSRFDQGGRDSQLAWVQGMVTHCKNALPKI